MSNRRAASLNLAQKVGLLVAGITALALPILMGTLTTTAVRAQTVQIRIPTAVEFDVAYKGTDAGEPDARARASTYLNATFTRWTMRDVPAMWLLMPRVKPHMLVQLAYNLKSHQILEEPPWANSDFYYVSQKTGVSGNFEQRRLMLRSMLAERFQLKAHSETRDLPIYRLVRAEGGVKMAPVKAGSCISYDVFLREADRRDKMVADGKDPGPPLAQTTKVCGTFRNRVLLNGLVRLEGFAVTIPQLIEVLSDGIGDPITNETGLGRTFDASLDYSPDDSQSPTIFTALPEQLGLRLQSATGPVEVLVVDHMERPTAN